MTIYPVPTLLSLFHHISGTKILQQQPHTFLSDYYKNEKFPFDMSDIRGQEKAKRVIEIAAAGGHNILLSGPPGAGKTLLARTLPSILPHLTLDEVLEVTKIYSISGLLEKSAIFASRPFRAPHHTTSHIGLIGGSATPHPGEISLAHRGVLFLDEFPEFPRLVMEALRQPLEDGIITISRAAGRVTFPAKFMLLAAQNPCPCGYFGDPTHRCSCQPGQILRYQKKISGPLLDRIDIHLNVPAVKVDKLTMQEKNQAESSSEIRGRVQKARDIQTNRFTEIHVKSNAEMTQKEIKTYCHLSEKAAALMRTAVTRMNLSARSYYRILKVARTIADLAEEKSIGIDHVAEALQYRPRPNSLQ